MSDNLNTARLPQGRRIDKNTEITPAPEHLARVLYALTVKPSGVVIGCDRRGQVVARYMDEEFAREEVAEANLEWDELLAPARQKQEIAEALAAKRQLSPNRRLRGERRAQRGTGNAERGTAKPGKPAKGPKEPEAAAA